MQDYHPLEGNDTAIVADPAALAASWTTLWNAITCIPNYATDLQGRLLIDVLNEPDGKGISWNTGSKAALGDYYLAAMDALYEVRV